jgi:hypothetical protein
MAMVDELEQPNLLVRLLETVGLLPTGPVYRLPRDVTLALIQRRVAVPVACAGVFCDLDVSEAELADVGIDWAVIQAA